MTIKCPECHFDNPADTAYCGKCGTKFDSAEEASFTKTLKINAEEMACGTIFAGRYEIIRELGAGGMGVVYGAQDTHLDRRVAIKVLPAEAVADQERKRRFVQEAKSASALNHPNIIHIYDIDQTDGVDFIAMEYVPGKTLDQWIEPKGLPVGEALKYAVQIADALAAAHAAGIVHRDLRSMLT